VSKFVQILHVPAYHQTFWALDEDGEIWECEDGRHYVDGKPELIWNRLVMKREGEQVIVQDTAARHQAEIVGAESFRKVVLNHLRNIQNDPRSESAAHIRIVVRNLLDQIELIDILEALGLK
jgi:hypothetical protein